MLKRAAPKTKSPTKTPEKPKVLETPKEPKPFMKPVEAEKEGKPMLKVTIKTLLKLILSQANGTPKELDKQPITVQVKQEPGAAQATTPSPRAQQKEMKPLTVHAPATGVPPKATPPIQQMTVPPASYAGPPPHGAYPPHPGYYQGL